MDLHSHVGELGLTPEKPTVDNLNKIAGWHIDQLLWDVSTSDADAGGTREVGDAADLKKFVGVVNTRLRTFVGRLDKPVKELTLVRIGLVVPMEVEDVEVVEGPDGVTGWIVHFIGACASPKLLRLKFVMGQRLEKRDVDVLCALAPALVVFLNHHGITDISMLPRGAQRLQRVPRVPVVPSEMLVAARGADNDVIGALIDARRALLRATGSHKPDLGDVALGNTNLESWLAHSVDIWRRCAAMHVKVQEAAEALGRLLADLPAALLRPSLP